MQRLSVLQAELDGLTKCPICLEDFVDPRSLTCLHTFCLRCLDVVVKRQGAELPLECPVCREESAVPAAGADGFRRNFYIDGLVAARRADADASVEQRVAADVALIAASIDELRAKATDIDAANRRFLTQIKDAKRLIRRSGEEVKREMVAMVDGMVERLVGELGTMRADAQRDSRVRHQQIQSTVDNMKEFKTRALEATRSPPETGTLASVADSLHTEADRLIASYVATAAEFSELNLNFKPLNVQDFIRNELIGTNWFGRPSVVRHSTAEKVLALYDFDHEHELTLAFSRGDVINVVAKADAEWWTGQLNGKTGLFPTNYVVSVSCLQRSSRDVATDNPAAESCVALYNYERQNEYELNLRKGDVIDVIEKLNDDWWTGRQADSDAIGLVLAGHVLPLSSLQESQNITDDESETATVLQNHTAESMYELDIRKGSTISIVAKLSADWCICRLSGHDLHSSRSSIIGLVPMYCIAPPADQFTALSNDMP